MKVDYGEMASIAEIAGELSEVIRKADMTLMEAYWALAIVVGWLNTTTQEHETKISKGKVPLTISRVRLLLETM